MILLDQRHRFDLPREIAFLDCAYPAPLMDAVVAGVSSPPGSVADEVSSRNDR